MSAIDRTLTCSSDGCNLATTAVTHTFSYGHYLESTALQIENYSDTHTLALQALFTPQTDLSDCRWGEALRFSLTTDTASGGQTLYDRLPVSTLATQPIAWEVAPDTTRTYYFVWTHTPRDYLSLRAFDNRDFVYQWTLDVEGQVNSSPEPTLPDPPPTPPPSPAPEATSAGTPTPEATPSAQLTPEATTSGDLTPEATPAASPIPSADPSVTPEASPTPTPQVNPASSPTPASSATASPTPASPLPVSAPSTTPAPTASSTPVSSASITSDASSTHPNDTGFTTTAKSNSASTITVPDVQAIIAADQTTSSASHRARARDNQQPNQVSTASQLLISARRRSRSGTPLPTRRFLAQLRHIQVATPLPRPPF